MIAMGLTQGTAVARPATPTGAGARAAAADDPYTQAFLTQYGKIKAAANGYFSPDGLPYHSAETLMVEAPDHGHETTSEAVSFWMWLEAAYGRVTGDWAPFNDAWAIAERTIIPQHADQSTTDAYNPSSPATYAPEWPLPDNYPSALDSSVTVGSDPIATELASSYGTMDIYGMHWLMDLDNTYGYGNKPGTGGESGPGAGPSFINTYQRGAQESVWETIPQPTTDLFNYGGPNGFLDLFVDDASYAKQWKYTNAPDADARAVQAAYWAYRWASAQGKEGEIAASVAKAAKMGDYLRYAMFDKYFKRIGSCTDPHSCPAASGRDFQHYLLSWYYAWGGAAAGSGGGWAKPPGESDGNSQPIDNDEGKGFDRMCDPTYTGNGRNGNNLTGALPDSPLAGHWFSAQFQELVRNAYPPLDGSGGGDDDTQAPSAPTGLTVTGKTSGSVSLSWSASTDDTGVTAYDVYRAGVQVGSSATTSFTDTGLTASTAYSYTVKARDAAGNVSAASAAVSATTSAGGGTGTGTLKVQYKNSDFSATDNQIRMGLQLVNTGTTAVNLSTVKVRYWFTPEAGASTFGTACDYAVLGCGSVTTGVTSSGSSAAGASHYLEVGFGSGSLAAGASTGEIQLRLNKSDWSNFNEADDYSRATNTAYADASKIGVYVGSTLAWGTAP
ncbi:glycoside hydrolase family 48 protein [Streptomyces sp. NPDC005181]|uniref:glycoside hydrolase family 48 protein n=1 Tax=Streptomyces sp. NPDC005181 TaxID=3156869 RepID=UPI0033A1DE59